MAGEPSFIHSREYTGKSGLMRPSMRIADYQVNDNRDYDLGWTKQPHTSRFPQSPNALPKRQPSGRTFVPGGSARRYDRPNSPSDRQEEPIRISPRAIQIGHGDRYPKHASADSPPVLSPDHFLPEPTRCTPGLDR